MSEENTTAHTSTTAEDLTDRITKAVPVVRSFLESVLGMLGVDVEVDIDLVAALAGGLAGDDGIALIAGTGSSCFGRDGTRRT